MMMRFIHHIMCILGRPIIIMHAIYLKGTEPLIIILVAWKLHSRVLRGFIIHETSVTIASRLIIHRQCYIWAMKLLLYMQINVYSMNYFIATLEQIMMNIIETTATEGIYVTDVYRDSVQVYSRTKKLSPRNNKLSPTFFLLYRYIF